MDTERISKSHNEIASNGDGKELGSIKLNFTFQGQAIRTNWFCLLNTDHITNEAWHSHSGIEIHFMISGSNTLLFDKKAIQLDPSEMLIIPTGTLHCLRNPSGENYMRYAMSLDIVDTKCDIDEQSVSEFLKLDEPIKYPVSDYILQLLEECENECRLQYVNYVQMIELNIMKILICLAREITEYRQFEQADCSKQTYSTIIANQVFEIIEENSSQNISVNSISQIVHLSPRHLQRIIQKEFHCTAKELITKARMQAAKSYLINTQLSISEISEAMNFSSEQSFSRFFRNNEGQTARDYRKGTLPPDPK